MMTINQAADKRCSEIYKVPINKESAAATMNFKNWADSGWKGEEDNRPNEYWTSTAAISQGNCQVAL